MVEDVYFLTVHEPYEEPGAPAPVNGLIVHASTLLHPGLPQPDAGRVYRCLTEFPGRRAGCVVPLAELKHELDDGRLWPQVADWQAVTAALIALSRTGRLWESMPIVIEGPRIDLLATAPGQPVHVITPKGVITLGDADRRRILAGLEALLPGMTGDPPLFCGHGLLTPPAEPAVMPYQPGGR